MQNDENFVECRRIRFSPRQIDALPPQDRDARAAMAEYSDTEVVGLKLAVSKTGRKYFWHRYRFRGRKRMIKLGEYPSVGVAQARQMVHDNKNMLGRDLDPADERSKKHAIPTLSEFATEEYLPYAKQHKRSWQDDESKLRLEIGLMLGDVQLTAITTRDVMQVHAAVKKRATAATANRYLILLTRIFNLEIQWGYLERNPSKGIKKYKESGPRQRFLSGDELASFLAALDAEAGKSTSDALKLLLLTGLRSKSELFSLPWSEVDLERGTVRLLHTKNGNIRTVALNSTALDLLRRIKSESAPTCKWVFPARSGSGHLVDIRKPLRRAMQRAGLQDLRPHDLRRSFGSLAVNAGVDIYQVKDLLGHSSVAVTQKVYAHLLQGTLRDASEMVAKTLESARSIDSTHSDSVLEDGETAAAVGW